MFRPNNFIIIAFRVPCPGGANCIQILVESLLITDEFSASITPNFITSPKSEFPNNLVRLLISLKSIEFPEPNNFFVPLKFSKIVKSNSNSE